MKKLTIIIVIITIGLFSCSRTNKFEKYDIIIIDSCQYIQYKTAYGSLNIEHKGNCNNPIHKHTNN